MNMKLAKQILAIGGLTVLSTTAWAQSIGPLTIYVNATDETMVAELQAFSIDTSGKQHGNRSYLGVVDGDQLEYTARTAETDYTRIRIVGGNYCQFSSGENPSHIPTDVDELYLVLAADGKNCHLTSEMHDLYFKTVVSGIEEGTQTEMIFADTNYTDAQEKPLENGIFRYGFKKLEGVDYTLSVYLPDETSVACTYNGKPDINDNFAVEYLVIDLEADTASCIFVDETPALDLNVKYTMTDDFSLGFHQLLVYNFDEDYRELSQTYSDEQNKAGEFQTIFSRDEPGVAYTAVFISYGEYNSNGSLKWRENKVCRIDPDNFIDKDILSAELTISSNYECTYKNVVEWDQLEDLTIKRINN